jgi:predicted Zn-dependent protease with MMP-like domain
MDSVRTALEGPETTFRRRRSSRGVHAPAREARHSVLARLGLIWQSMYPLPRLVITAVLFVAIAFGMVALFFLPPRRTGVILFYIGVPILIMVGIMIFAKGEPSDQTRVHWPKMSDAEFDALESQVDRLGRELASADDDPPHEKAQEEQHFIALVRQAIDELPPEFAHALDHVGVVVSDQGAVHRINGRLQPLYGLYVGYGGRGSYLMGAPVTSALPDHIVVFRDTLAHDFGHDPTRLRAEVTRVLRHEVAHHFGWDEPGVRGLGL